MQNDSFLLVLLALGKMAKLLRRWCVRLISIAESCPWALNSKTQHFPFFLCITNICSSIWLLIIWIFKVMMGRHMEFLLILQEAPERLGVLEALVLGVAPLLK